MGKKNPIFGKRYSVHARPAGRFWKFRKFFGSKSEANKHTPGTMCRGCDFFYAETKYIFGLLLDFQGSLHL